MPEETMSDEDAVLAANLAFYRAFRRPRPRGDGCALGRRDAGGLHPPGLGTRWSAARR